jgi:PRTRC genetic system protein A
MFTNLVTYAIHRRPPLPPSNARAYQYVMAGNGVFLRAENRFVSIIAPIARCRVRGLPPLEKELRLKIPRLPEPLLAAVVNDAGRMRAPDGKLLEALYHVHHTGRAACVVKPRQKASAAHVASFSGGDPDILLDLHSHGGMPAFWSATDNTDEVGFRFYAVIGRLDGMSEIRLRLGVYGYFVSLPLAALFAGPAGLQDGYQKTRTGYGTQD